jgi:hypothetical protein
MAAWSPWVDVVAVVVLGTVLVASVVWFGCRTRRMARTRPGDVYQRTNTTTGQVTYRAVDGAGRRSRKYRTEAAARRWLDRRQGRPTRQPHVGPSEHPLGSVWTCPGCRTWNDR